MGLIGGRAGEEERDGEVVGCGFDGEEFGPEESVAIVRPGIADVSICWPVDMRGKNGADSKARGSTP
jgi:hypothetical protein